MPHTLTDLTNLQCKSKYHNFCPPLKNRKLTQELLPKNSLIILFSLPHPFCVHCLPFHFLFCSPSISSSKLFTMMLLLERRTEFYIDCSTKYMYLWTLKFSFFKHFQGTKVSLRKFKFPRSVCILFDPSMASSLQIKWNTNEVWAKSLWTYDLLQLDFLVDTIPKRQVLKPRKATLINQSWIF